MTVLCCFPQAVLLCYDVTNYQSFQNLEDWYRLVKLTHDEDTMPTCALVGNKTDLNHMRTVRTDKHNSFATENDMCSFYMSAKTGDQVSACLYRLAADLAGVALTKPEVEVATKVVRAEIVNHARHDPSVPEDMPVEKKRCVIQ